MWRLKSLRLQADEGQDIGRSHGRKERLEGEDKEEHNHQHWLQLHLQGANLIQSVQSWARREEKDTITFLNSQAVTNIVFVW